MDRRPAHERECQPGLIYVNHNAGLGGRGTGSYLDQIICRERMVLFSGALGNIEPVGENPSPSAPANERLYYCQNRRADVVAIVSSSGRQVEQARYSAYGVPFGLLPPDAPRWPPPKNVPRDWDPYTGLPRPKPQPKNKRPSGPAERLPGWLEWHNPVTNGVADAIVWCCDRTGASDYLASMSNGEVYAWSIGTSVVVGTGGYYGVSYACTAGAVSVRRDAEPACFASEAPVDAGTSTILVTAGTTPAPFVPRFTVPVPMRYPGRLPSPVSAGSGRGNCFTDMSRALWNAL